MIYLDNAATSHPKPEQTIQGLNAFVRDVGGNPGRAGHTASVEAARIVFKAREKLAGLVNGVDSERMIFTANGTDSLNLALLGLIGEYDHVITTSMEHNSVMRPLTFLKHERKVEVSVARCSAEGALDPALIKPLIRSKTRAIIINHGSNVTGTIQDIGAVRRLAGDIAIIVDACQTVGSTPIDVENDAIDVLCFSCHKSLYGLQGLGALYIRRGLDPKPQRFGGTGSASESAEQPLFLPDRYECGTPNTPGIASLLGGLTFIESVGMDRIIERERNLVETVVRGLKETDKVVIYGDHGARPGLPVISFNVKGLLPSEVGHELNRRDIYVRVGLQCSPAAHETIGTFPHGTVRVSPGYFTTDNEIATFLEAVGEIAGS